MNAMDHSSALTRLRAEDAVGQLRARSGAMRELGSDAGSLLLDWVDAIPHLLTAPDALAEVEADARAIYDQGIRHIIWSGMGGSVLTVQVLRALGYAGDDIMIYPLNSTDPAALNHLLRQLGAAHGIDLAQVPLDDQVIHALLKDVALYAVAMGMTSEEPIAHLEWFGALLDRADLPRSAHLRVLALPDSFLDREAQAHHLQRLSLQLDGANGTPGRMSAPGTRVFLLPVAIDLVQRGAAPGTLRNILARAWEAYDLEGALTHPSHHPFTQLAAALSDASIAGCCNLYVQVPPGWDALRWWMEQLFEESLGKGGKGVSIFADQPVLPRNVGAPGSGAVRLTITLSSEVAPNDPGTVLLQQPLLAEGDPTLRLAGLAAIMLGLQLTVALYGYLHEIRFVGQPAVEDYKARARELRLAGNPLLAIERSGATEWSNATDTLDGVTGGMDQLSLYTMASNDGQDSRARSLLSRLQTALATQPRYLDITINGIVSAIALTELEQAALYLGNAVLHIPVKLREAPAAYHSTEQSEMDGPPGVLSIRLLARRHQSILAGEFDAIFLEAQGVGTWQAMSNQGRSCMLFVGAGDLDELATNVAAILRAIAQTS